jgi:hypothetical protein
MHQFDDELRSSMNTVGAPETEDDFQPLRSAYKISETRDLPALLHIRNTTFISHEQLFSFLVEKKLESNRRSFNWRVQRYLKCEYIRAIGRVLPYTGEVYTITRLGLSLLESFGEGLVSVSSESRTLPGRQQAPHFLELNEIRSAFRATGKLHRWQNDRQLTSLNYVIGTPLTKDYDAIAGLAFEQKVLRIAVEYERTLKTSARYQQISEAIRDEDDVDMILYLTPTPDFVFTLGNEFKKPELPMAFCASRRFRTSGLNATMLFSYGEMKEPMKLGEIASVILPLIA